MFNGPVGGIDVAGVPTAIGVVSWIVCSLVDVLLASWASWLRLGGRDGA